MKRLASVLGPTLLVVLIAWCVFARAESPSARSEGAPDQSANYSVRTLSLPDNNSGDIAMDYIAYDPVTNSVWVPAGNTAAVDVIDAATGKVRQVTGFPTKEMEIGGGKRVVGPSSLSFGEGVVYIGNRGDFSVCAVNARSLARGACGHVELMPDAVAYVAPTKEVWVTVPSDKSIRVLDGKTLEQKGKLTFEGVPEGVAVDARHGRFYTNLEDKDRTLAIDVKTQKIVSTWDPSCGKEGPRGLAVDTMAGHLFVACTTLAKVLDAGHDGAILSNVDTGDGVDDISYVPATRLLYVAASRAAKLTIARVDEKGQLSIVAQVPTHDGVRNAVVAKDGTVYLAHSRFTNLSGLLVASPGGK
jgi:DNA-binding beta-propeller fold protein YncE